MTDSPILRETDDPLAIVRVCHPSAEDRLALVRVAIDTAEQALAAGDVSAARMFLADALLHLTEGIVMAGYWNAHSDRDWEEGGREPEFDTQDEAEEAARQLREEIDGLKSTIQRLSADVEAAMKWAAAYEREHGPFKALPAIPDFMIPF